MDCLKDWPEPVVRVQSLSESGITTIPERYIKPASLRPEIYTPCSKELSIPVIDLSGLKQEEPSCNSTMQAISDAVREWGFLQVVNHGVSPALMKRAREDWRSFFHQPMEEKHKYANSPKTYEGYGSRLGIEKGAILDWGDYYFLHLLPKSLKDPNKWPSLPPSIKDIIEEYGKEVMKLCERLMKAMSVSLGVDEEYLQRAFGGEDVGVCMRTNYYPKCPQPELTLGLSAHSDPGGMTVLLVDDRVQGLQVRKDKVWVTIKPVPDAFIVNVGDQIQVLSNAIYKSVEHRVMVNAK
ncbi:probable 2-oxoglutarate-dependent dioxygenase At5g05600 [Dioscorea cayenensis subsp. rotundata]|uniref:Probable 2-oxoglutarate-dependent dioxygenase At5g05600 n=1 Tax=Dioscorea cayennensis subsp. rotundata TaxID=55577 RepID=A0AB40BLS7_DIOCR|nr:probable 2-oxoglutarate-dependent dioxygenase At5g05600 [Dioscorea cayenensis subsp. rotundata]